MRSKLAKVCFVLVWVVCCAGLVISGDYDFPKPGSYPPYDGAKSDFEFPASWGDRLPGVARLHHRNRSRANHFRGKLQTKGKVKNVLARCFDRSCH